MEKFKALVEENSSINHPWYLRILLDGHEVHRVSYKSEIAAKKDIPKVTEELLLKYFRIVKKAANALEKSKLVEHADKQYAFHGTSHFDD